MLSGASLSRWVDQTAVIYNPATMLQATTRGITFNTAAGSIDNIKIENALGQKNDITSSSFQSLTGLIAGDFKPLSRKGKTAVGYALYHRMRDVLRTNSQFSQQVDLLPEWEAAGQETLLQSYSVNNETDEMAAAVGWAYRINKDFSIGISQQFIYRSANYNEYFSASVIADPAVNPLVPVVSSTSNVMLRYYTVLGQTRLSAAWQHGPWDAGLIITTPSYGLYRYGNMAADIRLFNILIDSLNARKSFVANAYVDKGRPVWRYPFSVGLGLSRRFSKVQVSGSATWYAPQERYVVLDPSESEFVQPPSSANVLYTKDFLQVWGINRQVVNAAVSADWTLSQKTSLLFGFRTNRHFSDTLYNVPGFQLAKKLWDVYHVTAGVQMEALRNRWIVGVEYMHGQEDKYRMPYSFLGAAESNFLRGTPPRGKVWQNGLMLMLSFTFNLGQNPD